MKININTGKMWTPFAKVEKERFLALAGLKDFKEDA